MRHGTLAMYTTGKCRCKWCRMANNAYHGANQARLRGANLRVVSPTVLTEKISIDLSADQLEAWRDAAEAAGLSAPAYIRRSVDERAALDRALQRQREQELARPLLDHGG